MTYLNYKKRKNGFPEVTTEVITPEKPIKQTEEAIKNLLRPIFEEWIFDETMSKADFETMVTDYFITVLTELAS